MPRTRSAAAVESRALEAWMRPRQVEGSDDGVEVGGGAVISKGCKGIGGSRPRPIDMLIGVVQGT